MAITMTEDFKRGLAVGLSIGGVQVGGSGSGGGDNALDLLALDIEMVDLILPIWVIEKPQEVFGEEYQAHMDRIRANQLDEEKGVIL